VFKIKISKFFLTVLIINIILFIFIYLLPINILQCLIGHLVKVVVFVFGVRLEVIRQASGFILKTDNGQMLLYQSFYEFLTIISLTIPLYWQKWEMLFKKLIQTLAIMFCYYVILYSSTIVILEFGHKATLLRSFIDFNTEAFMIFAFTLVWVIVNKNELSKFRDCL
jgi:hypothetical protein